MTFEYTPPKYAQIIRAIQERIESGEYPPGSLLPSEHQLSAEFGTARPTVVRALRVLRGDKWIETEQGKGSFVRGRPALSGTTSARRGQAELDRDESREPGELISAGTSPAPPRIAELLGVDSGTELAVRSWLARQEDGSPSEILTWWLPPDLARQVGLDSSRHLVGGLRSALARTAGVRIDHVVEQVMARRPEPNEAKLLGIPRSTPVLALYVSARDASGHPVAALDVAMPGDLHELEDAYPVG